MIHTCFILSSPYGNTFQNIDISDHVLFPIFYHSYMKYGDIPEFVYMHGLFLGATK